MKNTNSTKTLHENERFFTVNYEQAFTRRLKMRAFHIQPREKVVQEWKQFFVKKCQNYLTIQACCLKLSKFESILNIDIKFTESASFQKDINSMTELTSHHML